jgi:hypothetical protein
VATGGDANESSKDRRRRSRARKNGRRGDPAGQNPGRARGRGWRDWPKNTTQTSNLHDDDFLKKTA